MVGGMIAALLSTGSLPVAPPAEQVDVSRAEVRLADVLDLESIPPPLRERARSLTLVRLRPAHPVTVSDAQAAAKARALMPALAAWLPAPAGRTLTFRLLEEPEQREAVGACVRALRVVAAGETAATVDFEPAACPRTRQRAWRLEPVSGSVRAVRPIAPGEPVPAWPSFGTGDAEPGMPLTLRSTAGAVSVERPVASIQTARPGERLFVRSGDATLHAVRYEGGIR
jgi:hypothetical protein